ncbi:hypothetical protein TcWFU_000898 [Taenia crassiceps]|uniref:Tetraspanin n=1 Tax=Taenia crassiceps TaxID=6207 RepID=A0ABR4Q328_9CEST
MGRAISRSFRIVFLVITTFLFLGFLLTAVGGVVMKTSTSAIQSTVKVALGEYGGDADDLHQFSAFLLESADTMATYCIVIGVMLAVLSMVGLIASYSNWNKMLKTYAIILLVLLVVQIIVVAVIFSDPINFANGIVRSTEILLKSYGDGSEEGNRATVIWDVLMKVRV